MANLLLSFLTLSLTFPPIAHAGPTVTILNGTYKGYHLPAQNQDLFLGMPYAQPPVGDLRFRAPASLNESWSGVRPALNYSDVCMQYTADPGWPMSEDCLSVNVIRPANHTSSGKKLPVAVWIYGGGLYSGGSPSTNLTNFVHQSVLARKPLIAVSLNYRLTAFGFLWDPSFNTSLSGSASANNGLRDQRLALHWIRENIEYFGGNASEVTIFGQSSGALSVGKQLIAYGGRDDGLFRGAILQSGGMAEKWPYNIKEPGAYTADLYRNLTVTTGCVDTVSTTDALECLRALPVEKLSEALNVTDTPVFSGTGLGPWLTQVDGDFLRDGPTESLEKGHFVKVPIMYTNTADEATAFMYGGDINTDADFRAFVAAGGPDNTAVSMIETLYPNINAIGLPAGYEPTNETEMAYGVQYKRAVAFQTDVVETASRRKTVDTWAKAGGTAFSGLVDILAPGVKRAVGVTHGTELEYIFNTLESNNTELVAMSELMSRMWASFVADGDPNNHGVAGVPTWPKWTTSNADAVGSNFVFSTDGTKNTKSYVALDDYRIAQTKYLSSVMETQMYY